ncbi:MAG: hypothetical protein QW734_10230 [Candidatus Bathyarchaeia archaeon]
MSILCDIAARALGYENWAQLQRDFARASYENALRHSELEARKEISQTAAAKFQLFFMLGLTMATLGWGLIGNLFFMLGTSVLCYDVNLKIADTLQNKNLSTQAKRKLIESLLRKYADKINQMWEKLHQYGIDLYSKEFMYNLLKDIQNNRELVEKFHEIGKMYEFLQYLEKNNWDVDKTMRDLYEAFQQGLLEFGNANYGYDYIAPLAEAGYNIYGLFEKEFAHIEQLYREREADLKEMTEYIEKTMSDYIAYREFADELRERYQEDLLKAGFGADATIQEIWAVREIVDRGGIILTEEEYKMLQEWNTKYEEKIEPLITVHDIEQEMTEEMREYLQEKYREEIEEGYEKEQKKLKKIKLTPDEKKLEDKTVAMVKNAIKNRQNYSYEKEPWLKPYWHVTKLYKIQQKLQSR